MIMFLYEYRKVPYLVKMKKKLRNPLTHFWNCLCYQLIYNYFIKQLQTFVLFTNVRHSVTALVKHKHGTILHFQVIPLNLLRTALFFFQHEYCLRYFNSNMTETLIQECKSNKTTTFWYFTIVLLQLKSRKWKSYFYFRSKLRVMLRYDLPNGLYRIHICIFYQKINKFFFIKM